MKMTINITDEDLNEYISNIVCEAVKEGYEIETICFDVDPIMVYEAFKESYEIETICFDVDPITQQCSFDVQIVRSQKAAKITL